MKSRTPKHLVALLPLVSLSLGGTITLIGTGASMASVALVCAPHVAFAAGPDTTSGGVTHRVLPTIAVLGVSDLDEEGKAHAIAHGESDAIAFSMAEEAISGSHAFHLLSRDQMSQQVKEIKMDGEGFVESSSAQKFGKSAGVQSFVTVFISGTSAKRIFDPGATDLMCPTNGDVVPAALTGEPAKVGGGSGGFWQGFANGLASSNTKGDKGRNLLKAHATIMCRFTKVETGERTTVSFDGAATADANTGDEKKLEQAAVKNAFDNFSRNLEKNRPPLMGNVSEIADGKAVVDIGEADGVHAQMPFEICEVKKIGSFTSYSHVCDAQVAEVNANIALLEIGEFKKGFLQTTPSFHQKDDKAKLVKVGFIIREKHFD